MSQIHRWELDVNEAAWDEMIKRVEEFVESARDDDALGLVREGQQLRISDIELLLLAVTAKGSSVSYAVDRAVEIIDTWRLRVKNQRESINRLQKIINDVRSLVALFQDGHVSASRTVDDIEMVIRSLYIRRNEDAVESTEQG